MSDRLRSFEEQLDCYDERSGELAQNDSRTGLLMTVLDVGPLIATVGDACQFKSRRELSASFGYNVSRTFQWR